MNKRNRYLAVAAAALLATAPVVSLATNVEAAPQTTVASSTNYRKWLFNEDQRRAYDIVALRKTPVYTNSATEDGEYKLKLSGQYISKGKDIAVSGINRVVEVNQVPYFEIENPVSNDLTYVRATDTQGIHFLNTKDYKKLVKQFKLDKYGEADQVLVKAKKNTKVYTLTSDNLLGKTQTLKKDKHYTLVDVELTMHNGEYYLQDDVSAVKAADVKIAGVDESADNFE